MKIAVDNHLLEILSYQRVSIYGGQLIPLTYIAYKDIERSEGISIAII